MHQIQVQPHLGNGSTGRPDEKELFFNSTLGDEAIENLASGVTTLFNTFLSTFRILLLSISS